MIRSLLVQYWVPPTVFSKTYSQGKSLITELAWFAAFMWLLLTPLLFVWEMKTLTTLELATSRAAPERVWRQPGEEYKNKCVLPTVKHGGASVMVWGCMSAADTGELQFIEETLNANMYCDIQKQSMIPSLRRLGCRAVFRHDNDPKHTSKTTTALLKKLRVKVMDWPSMSPDLNPIEHLWGILKWKVEEHKVSNIHQLCDVVMEEWKRTPVATCEAVLNANKKTAFFSILTHVELDVRFTQNMSVFRRDMTETLRCEGVSESSSSEMMS
ncbi:Transposable element Tcb1 transposase [Varanus komodoensis]|nr:Transposable element Tcb1 transposase [Varanus komodoensis]